MSKKREAVDGSGTPTETVEETVKQEIKIVEEGAPKAKTPIEEFVDHQRRALEETGKAIEALLPEGFKTHSKEASKEFTKGFKILVDAAVNELEKASRELDKQFRARQQPAAAPTEGERPSTTGATKVKVQVD